MESKKSSFFGFFKTAVDLVRILILAAGTVMVLWLLYSVVFPTAFGRTAGHVLRLEIRDSGVITLRQGTLPDAEDRVVVPFLELETRNPGIVRLFLIRNVVLLAGLFFLFSLARAILRDALGKKLGEKQIRFRIRWLGYSLIAAAFLLTFADMIFASLMQLRLLMTGVTVSFSLTPSIVLFATGSAVLFLAAAFEKSMG